MAAFKQKVKVVFVSCGIRDNGTVGKANIEAQDAADSAARLNCVQTKKPPLTIPPQDS